MLKPSLKIFESAEGLTEFIGLLFEQYPGHLGALREHRRRKRRSEFVRVALQVGGPHFKVTCLQLSELPSLYGGNARTLRTALTVAEEGGGEPVLFEFRLGNSLREAVVNLKGRKLTARAKDALEAVRSMPGSGAGKSPLEASGKEMQMLVAALTNRVLSLESHLAKHQIAIPDGYPDLVHLSNSLAGLVLSHVAEQSADPAEYPPSHGGPRGHHAI